MATFAYYLASAISGSIQERSQAKHPWLGNAYYAEIGVKIIGSHAFKNEPKVEKTRMQQRITPEAYAKTTQEFPSIFVEEEMLLNINALKVNLISVNKKAHTM